MDAIEPRKPGRPYSAPGTGKTKHVQFRVTDAEYVCIRDAARRDGKSLSDYSRDMLVDLSRAFLAGEMD